MKTYPLSSLTITEAKQMQFKLVDIITQHFQGSEILTLGDLGVVSGLNKPITTLKAEQVLADFFDAEAAVLVRGAGTSAIRSGLVSMIKPGQNLLIHDAPLYPTTRATVESMGLNLIKTNFNSEQEILSTMQKYDLHGALVQHTRQKIDDCYDFFKVITAIKKRNTMLPVISDDNYAVMKVKAIGVQCGAEMSAFSLFKLLGPEGIGCVVGKKAYIDSIIKSNYSGGGQVQGHEALAALRGLIYAPVALALQAEVNEEVVARLNEGEIPGVKRAFLANAQSKVILVELERPLAKEVLKTAQRLGAAPNPVGAESKYEFVPMFYRVSGTFIEADKTLADRMIRINPMRSGADTVIRILKTSIKEVL